jgi:hypothetical protein
MDWYENLKIEQLNQEWLDAEDEGTRKKIAAAIQLENYAQRPTVTLASSRFLQPIARAWQASWNSPDRYSGTSKGA